MREYNQAHSNRKNSGTESAIFWKNFIAYSSYRWHWHCKFQLSQLGPVSVRRGTMA